MTQCDATASWSFFFSTETLGAVFFFLGRFAPNYLVFNTESMEQFSASLTTDLPSNISLLTNSDSLESNPVNVVPSALLAEDFVADEEPSTDVRSRDWCFTINNYQNLEPGVLATLKANMSTGKYWILGKEVCPTTGTPHLQGFFWLEHARTWSSIRRMLAPAKAWFKKCKGTAWQNFVYCSKMKDFEEWGRRPFDDKESAQARGEASKRKHAEAILMAERGDFKRLRSEEPALYVQRYNTFKAIYKDNLGHVEQPLEALDNWWFYGPTGSFKSRTARAENPRIFKVNPEKPHWWCNYNGEECVLVDDIDPNHAKPMTWFVKVVADHYPFDCEYKGGMLYNVRPKRVICTSNWTIEEVFGANSPDTPAILRRFKVRRFPEERGTVVSTDDLSETERDERERRVMDPVETCAFTQEEAEEEL